MSTPYKNLAALAKAFSDSNRLLILERLAQGPCNVEELAVRTGIVFGNLSHHLQILKYSSLVNAKRQGRQIVYSIQSVMVIRALNGLKNLSDSLSSRDDEVLNKLPLLIGPQVPREDAYKMIQLGSAILLDVRPVEEFNAGHIRGAVNIPLEELERRLGDLPQDKLIVSYCRGPYCQLSMQASEILHKQGLKVKTLEDGYPEWWAEGLPVEGLDGSV